MKMGDYSSMNNRDFYWDQQGEVPPNPQGYYGQDFSQFQNQQLEFNTIGDYGDQSFNSYPPTQMYNPTEFDAGPQGTDEFDEPPLLEELEIYPDRILQKIIAVLNPLRGHSITDDPEYLTKEADLAGPISFWLMLAVCLFLSGNKAQFGYIYGISMISCILMYFLLTLMTPTSGTFTLSTVASILGYCIIPVVGLSTLGVFFTLNSLIGIILSVIVVFWSSLSASRLFVAVSGDKQQQPLIAYPCALVYGVYILLVLF